MKAEAEAVALKQKKEEEKISTSGKGEEVRRDGGWMKHVKCYNCNKFGHFARNCGEPSKMGEGRRGRGREYGNGEVSKMRLGEGDRKVKTDP